MFQFSIRKSLRPLFEHRLSPFLIEKNKDGTAVTRAAHYSAGSEDMPWLCHWTPQHAIADLHMLAAESFHVSIPYPQMPRVFSGYCLIQTEFHQLSLWLSGLRTDLSLGSPFWVTQNRL